jgi:hypothetical protein
LRAAGYGANVDASLFRRRRRQRDVDVAFGSADQGGRRRHRAAGGQRRRSFDNALAESGLGPIGDIPPAEFEAQYYTQASVA